MGARDPFRNRFSAYDMLLQNALAALRRDLPVPNAFGVDEKPGAADTDAKTSRLGAHDGEMQLTAAALKIIPRRLAFGHRRAIGAEAEEEMALRVRDSSCF